MKKFPIPFSIFHFPLLRQGFGGLIFSILYSPLTFAQYQYTSPKANSTKLPVEHNIVLRSGALLNPSSLQRALFTIQGSASGVHDFVLVLCDDGKTINLNPTVYFSFEEIVTVTITEGLLSSSGAEIPPYSFTFTTMGEWIDVGDPEFGHTDSTEDNTNGGKLAGAHSNASEQNTNVFTVSINIKPSPGHIFFDYRPRIASQMFSSSLNIINNDGDSVYTKPFTGFPYDFKLGANGLFSTHHGVAEHFDVMDSNFNVIDSFAVTNGFLPDAHEMIMLEDGSVFLTALENQPVNDSSMQVIQGSVIQQFDPHHNLIFEWRSADYVNVSEATYESTLGGIDYVHTNSIDVDWDGNILVSHRHLNQINKIDVSTGKFIWRLGGVNNEFTFLNDTARFTYQHCCSRLANGNILLYDNGNYHVPQRTYVKEYELDEVNKTANLVWSYSHPDVDGNPAFYTAMGSAQRLPNGNTFINWGWTGNNFLPSMTEVDASGNIVWEMKIPATHVAYRAHKYEWNPCARPTSGLMNTTNLSVHSVSLNWQPVANTLQYEVQFKKHNDSAWTSIFISSANSFLELNNLESETEYDWRVRTWCEIAASISSYYTEIKTFTTPGIEFDESDILFVYPNPVTDHLYVETHEVAGLASVRNVLGEVVMAKSITPNGIDVSSLADGVYFLTVEVSHALGNVNLKLFTVMFVKKS